MKIFSEIGIGLGLIFCFLFLAIIAELYYLLWWKKRININTEIEENYTNFGKKNGMNQEIERNPDANCYDLQDPEIGFCKNSKNFGEESVELELMRVHNLAGPPRFLFPIKEESKEDLESDDGKSKSRKGSRSRSLSDFIGITLASPPLKSSPWNQFDCCYNIQHGLNPLFESSSSPPSKFKFLRDAEEKLGTRLKEVSEIHNLGIGDARNGSFLNFIVGKNRELEIHNLGSSPATRDQIFL